MQSKPQQPSRKHHYIPEFYQKSWTTEGKLVVFQKSPIGIFRKWRSPAASGYMKELYTIADLPPKERQMIEEEYMRPLDDLAAVARDKLVAKGKITPKQRGAWVQFLLSLMMRTPEELALFRESYKQQFSDMREPLAEQYLANREQGEPETYDEHLVQKGPGGIEKDMMLLFLKMITSERIASVINQMTWSTFDVSKAGRELMTSDRPIIMPYGLGRDYAYIAMPLTPTILFLATVDDPLIKSQMAARGSHGVVADINAAVVGNAYQFVYAADERQARFIENRMGKLPRWSLVERMTARFARDDALSVTPARS